MPFQFTLIPNISYKKKSHGSLSGVQSVDVGDAFWHEVTVGGALTLSFTGYDADAGDVVRFLVAFTNPGTNLTLAGATFHYAGGSAPSYTASGVDIVGFYSVDGGSNIFVFPALDMQSA
jgi:hypothetical protein